MDSVTINDNDPTAVLLASFGGPRTRDDVMPFLRNVTRGKNVPDERLAVVAQHYYERGGNTPINEQVEALRAAMVAELAARNEHLPVYIGNRNWEPYIGDALRQLHDDGHRRLRVVTTSAYASYSGCRQYRENIASAVDQAGFRDTDFSFTKIDHYWDTDGFVTAYADSLRERVAKLDPATPVRVAFVTHSIPVAMAAASGEGGDAYIKTHKAAARRIAAAAGLQSVPWDLVYCSRSGPPAVPWTEPDINDYLRSLAGTDEHVVIVPSGFVSDHMEVLNDLDVEALETARSVGVSASRARTALTHPAFVASLVDSVLEPRLRVCPAGCCPNLRQPHAAAVCGERDTTKHEEN